MKGSKFCEAELIEVTTISYEKIQTPILVLDTAMIDIDGIEALFRKFGMKDTTDKMMILIFRKK